MGEDRLVGGPALEGGRDGGRRGGDSDAPMPPLLLDRLTWASLALCLLNRGHISQETYWAARALPSIEEQMLSCPEEILAAALPNRIQQQPFQHHYSSGHWGLVRLSCLAAILLTRNQCEYTEWSKDAISNPAIMYSINPYPDCYPKLASWHSRG